jgi:signal transduction histidine kinase
VGLVGGLALLVSVLAYSGFVASRDRILRFLSMEAEAVTRAGLQGQDFFVMQREFDRIARIVDDTFGYPVRLVVVVDGKKIAESTTFDRGARFTTTADIALEHVSGHAASLEVVVEYSNAFTSWGISLLGLTAAISAATIFLSRLVRASVCRVTMPIEEAIARLDMLSSSLGQDDCEFGVNPGVEIRELQALQSSVTRLLVNIKHYRAALEESHREKLEIERRTAVSQAVAGMTQMLAHDVRRPFSTLKVAITVLRSAQHDPERLALFLDRLEQTLPKTIAKVEGLIADVMEIGATTPPRPEPCLIREIVDEAVAEVFPDGIPANLSVERLESQDAALFVEARKVLRAVANILQNARDALVKKNGVIRISSMTINANFVRLTILNTNSHIPPDVLPNIFGSFVTAKKGGTGLGLAIAKKVTEAHGGEISCDSVEGVGVSFHIDLPCVSPSLKGLTTSQGTSSAECIS